MKKNSPGCTCCVEKIFTQGDAFLSALSKASEGVTLPTWVASVNNTVRGLPHGGPAEYGVAPAGRIYTPEGWLYFISHRDSNDGSMPREVRYTFPAIDLANNEFISAQTQQPPPVVTRTENNIRTVTLETSEELVDWLWPNIKIATATPGHDVTESSDFVIHMTHADNAGGVEVSEWTDTDIPSTIPEEEIVSGWVTVRDTWNPDYIAWAREAAGKTEPAHGIEVYSPAGELVHKYSVPGASVKMSPVSVNAMPEVASQAVAPTGESVYWLANAGLVQWMFRQEFSWYWEGKFNRYVIDDFDYGDTIQASSFPFADLVDNEQVLKAAGAEVFTEGAPLFGTLQNYQAFEFLIYNDEPLALLPMVEGTANIDTPGRTPIPVTCILEHACISYSHAVDAPILVGSFSREVVKAGDIYLSAQDTVTLSDAGLREKIIVYKYEDDWKELARIDPAALYTSARHPAHATSVCEGINGAMYILGGRRPGSRDYVVYRLDPGSGEVQFSGIYTANASPRNWFSLPTNPDHNHKKREAQNPPPTIGGVSPVPVGPIAPPAVM